MEENQNNNYFFNKNDMTVKFFKNFEWSLKLSPYEFFLSPVYVKESFWFRNGKINLERFLNSMVKTIDHYYYILSKFERNQNGEISACYKPNSEEYQKEILEIEYRENESINVIDDEDVIYPNKIISDAQNICFASDLNGLFYFSMKLLILKDGFIIGYNANHSFFDQSSIYYFTKYLSNCYNYGNENKLNKPYLANSLKFIDENLKFKNIEDARKFGNDELGFTYFNPEICTTNDVNSIDVNTDENMIIQLKFDLEQMNKIIKDNFNYSISRNDIITSCLLKLRTLTPLLKDEDLFTLNYANDLRNHLEYGEDAQSNFALCTMMKFKVNEIRSLGLYDLAKYNRQMLRNVNANTFKKYITWFKYLQDRNEDIKTYLGKYSLFRTGISNWSSFKYDQINFDGVKQSSLKTPNLSASIGISVITYDTDVYGKKFLITHLSVPKNCIDKAIQLSNQSNIFKINNINPKF